MLQFRAEMWQIGESHTKDFYIRAYEERNRFSLS